MSLKEMLRKGPASSKLFAGLFFSAIGAAVLIFGVLTTGSSVIGVRAAESGPEPVWAAAAPGRVEPKGRELRVGAPAPSVIREVLVQLNDRVKAGDLLIRLDDAELKAKLAAVEAEAAAREADRNATEAKSGAHDRRKAEDNLYDAERDAFDARMDLDRLISLARVNQAGAKEVEKGRATVATAEQKVDRERANLKRIMD